MEAERKEEEKEREREREREKIIWKGSPVPELESPKLGAGYAR
jgi:hypothetical protein